MLSQFLISTIELKLSALYSKEIVVTSCQPVSGGDINYTYRLVTNHSAFFVKVNSASSFPKMFEKEANGLSLLREANVIKVPEVIAFVDENDSSFLILEWIESTTPETNFWQNLGMQLAQIHKNSSDSFGFGESNFIGSLTQSNKRYSTWVEFFINERLDPQIKIAIDSRKMDDQTVIQFENLFKELPNIFPEEPPAFLHGDLWSGNYMVGNNGEPVIMDPAVYYGHREMDLAMTKLFGGFDAQMYNSYNENYPLEKDWENRLAICNLYPLLVHVNLFGGSYISQIKTILKFYA